MMYAYCESENDHHETLPHDVRHEKRVHLTQPRKEGFTYDALAPQRGLNRTGVSNTCECHEQGRVRALHDRIGGRKLAANRLRSGEQERENGRLVKEQMPDQVKTPYPLRSRKAIAALVLRRFGIRLAVRTMGTYLKRWAFTPQKPLRRAYEQLPAAAKQRLATTFPATPPRARKGGAEIHWSNETALRSDDARGYSFAPVGKTCAVRVDHKRKNLSIISTVTNNGQMRWKICEGAINVDILIDFMTRLIRDAERKGYLILNDLFVHHDRPVKEWLTEHARQIQVFHLPSYRSELNPDEMTLADIKQAVTCNAAARIKLQLAKTVSHHPRSVHEQAGHVRCYFHRDVGKYTGPF